MRTLRLAADRWPDRGWSKAATVAGAWRVTVTIGTLVLPLGTTAVIWHTHTVARRPSGPSSAVPSAEGQVDQTEESPS